MPITEQQKMWKREAKIAGGYALEALVHATDEYRDEFHGYTHKEWADSARKWAERAAHAAFMSGHVNREIGYDFDHPMGIFA